MTVDERPGRQRGSARQLVLRLRDVDPDPADDVSFRPFQQDARHLAASEQDVVRPLDPRRVAALLDRLGHGEARDERELGVRGAARWPEEHGEEQRLPCDVLPPPAQAAAAGGLVLGDRDGALGQVGGAERILRRGARLAPEVRPAEAAAEQRLDDVSGEELVVIQHKECCATVG